MLLELQEDFYYRASHLGVFELISSLYTYPLYVNAQRKWKTIFSFPLFDDESFCSVKKEIALLNEIKHSVSTFHIIFDGFADTVAIYCLYFP